MRVFLTFTAMLLTTIGVVAALLLLNRSTDNPLYHRLLAATKEVRLPIRDGHRILWGVDVTDRICPYVTRELLEEMAADPGARGLSTHQFGPDTMLEVNANTDQWQVSFHPEWMWIRIGTISLDRETGVCRARVNMSKG